MTEEVKQRITYGKDIEIVVRVGATIQDEMRGQQVYMQLVPLSPGVKYGLWNQFGELCSQTLSARGLPFDPLTILEQDSLVLLDAYNDFLKLPKRLYKAWLEGCQGQMLPVESKVTDDPNLTPPSNS